MAFMKWSSVCVGYTPLMGLRLATVLQSVEKLGYKDLLTKTNNFDEYNAQQMQLIDQITSKGDIITVHTHVRYYDVNTRDERINLLCQFYTKDQKPTLLNEKPSIHNTFYKRGGFSGMTYTTKQNGRVLDCLDISLTGDDVTVRQQES